MNTLLGIFAHPDDESYMAGGTIAKYVKAGWTADLVCVTHGEAGNKGEFEAATKEMFGQIRKGELQAAAGELGVRSVTFLEFGDGKVAALPAGELEESIAKILRDERPDVVVTFEPAGVTNHPDHMKVTLSTTFAFQKYAKERASDFPDDPNPPKLYYACLPESSVSYFVKKGYFPAESFGQPWRGIEDKKISTVIDIKRTAAVKARALRAHVSQKEEIEDFLSVEHNPFMRQEYFMLRYVGLAEAYVGKNDRVSDRL